MHGKYSATRQSFDKYHGVHNITLDRNTRCRQHMLISSDVKKISAALVECPLWSPVSSRGTYVGALFIGLRHQATLKKTVTVGVDATVAVAVRCYCRSAKTPCVSDMPCEETLTYFSCFILQSHRGLFRGRTHVNAIPIVKVFRTPKMHHIAGFCVYDLKSFPSLISSDPHSAWTQTPVSAWLASVPIVPVLRNDHCFTCATSLS